MKQVFVTTEAEKRDVKFCKENSCRDCGKTSQFPFQDRTVGKVALCGKCFFEAARFEQQGKFPFD
jgi:hypothetical protein